MMIGPLSFDKADNVRIVVLDLSAIGRQDLPSPTIDHRRGFPPRWPHFGDVHRKLRQGEESARMANHGLRRHVQRGGNIPVRKKHKEKSCPDAGPFSLDTCLE